MLKPVTAALLALGLSTPAFAADPVKGEASFRKCKACHSIIGADGTEVQKGGTTGPNLWGLVGHPVASDPDFNYGNGILAAREKGAIWDEAELASYLQDPSAWVKAASDDPGATSKMTFRLPREEEAADVAAYLATLGGDPAAAGAEGAVAPAAGQDDAAAPATE